MTVDKLLSLFSVSSSIKLKYWAPGPGRGQGRAPTDLQPMDEQFVPLAPPELWTHYGQPSTLVPG